MSVSSLNSLLNATSAGTCAPDAAFVTLVANESYVSGALCLRRTLQRVGSVCPLLLVVADPLPTPAMEELTNAFGSGRIRLLSSLRRRLDRYLSKQADTMDSNSAAAAHTGRRLVEDLPETQPSGPIKSTRELQRSGGWARRTHKKLLLFALRGLRKAAFLDIDMLVLRNLDVLLDQPAFAAVAALPYTRTSFNSGVFVFEPSLETAAALDDLSQRATFKPVRKGDAAAIAAAGGKTPIRIRASGERFALSDQSILNHYYRTTWRQLPYGYNVGVKVRQAAPKMWRQIELAVVHYVHRPKPWGGQGSHRARTHHTYHCHCIRALLTVAWCSVCDAAGRRR